MINELGKFVGGDPPVAGLLIFALCVLIGAVAVVVNSALERRHRRRTVSVRQQLERIVQASEPRPWTAPASKGFDRNRRVS